MGGQAGRDPQYPGKADPSQGGDPDRAEALSGENRALLLQKEPEWKKRLKKAPEYYKMEQVKKKDMCYLKVQFKEDYNGFSRRF